jgi:hypothetical protein
LPPKLPTKFFGTGTTAWKSGMRMTFILGPRCVGKPCG